MPTYSSQTSPPKPGSLRLLGSVFLGLGLLALYFAFIGPLIKIIGARAWKATDCRIISSALRTHRGSKSTTYSIDISFAYVWESHEYVSNRYSFFTGSSSGTSGKEAVIRHFPPGSAAVCYVDPAEPAQAVLERGLTSSAWFGLIALPFIGVGVGSLVFAGRVASASGDKLVRSF